MNYDFFCVQAQSCVKFDEFACMKRSGHGLKANSFGQSCEFASSAGHYKSL